MNMPSLPELKQMAAKLAEYRRQYDDLTENLPGHVDIGEIHIELEELPSRHLVRWALAKARLDSMAEKILGELTSDPDSQNLTEQVADEAKRLISEDIDRVQRYTRYMGEKI